MNRRIKRKAFLAITLAIVFFAASVMSGCIMAKRKKSRQPEAKTNLAAIFTASLAYFAEYNKRGLTFNEIGSMTEGETRYSYYLSCDEVIPSTTTGYKECPAELKKWFSERCDDPADFDCFGAGAVGNIDKDETLDIWVIGDNKIPVILVDDTKN